MNKSLIKENKASRLNSLENLHISLFLNISDIYHDINKKKLCFFNICYQIKNDIIFAEKTFNLEFLEEINKYYDYINEEELQYFKEKMTFTSVEELILFSFFELAVSIDLLNKKIINEKEFSTLINNIDYVREEDKNKVKLLSERKKRKRNETKNTALLITNKYNYEFPRDINKIRNKKLKEYINQINLPLIELPFQKDIKNVELFFENLIKIQEKLKIKKFNFNLRIKRIKKMKKNGMFIVAANTIIIDPRTPEAIIHEIGHYIYENGLSFNLNGKRVYRCQFDKIIAKNTDLLNDKPKINKHEDYDEKSEIFAYWFEKEYSFSFDIFIDNKAIINKINNF